MSILMQVKRSKVYGEFSPQEQERYFSLKASKTLHHIDSLYYSVTLNEEWVLENNFLCPEILYFLKALSNARKIKMEKPDDDVKLGDLSVSLLRKRNYTYCLSEPELFDVFIAEELPNGDTPRIIVEIRTRMLIMLGTAQAIIDSFDKVQELLCSFNIGIKEVNESRIDYAYHTNLIQDPNSFFDDKFIKKHLNTNMTIMHKVLNPKRMLHNYISLGSRPSQNVFTRVYDKTREVIEKNYKNFFIERWRYNGLISEYDHWCLNYAYALGSYTVGLLVARIQWYIEYGKNCDTKTYLEGILQKYDIDSSNSDILRKVCQKLHGKRDVELSADVESYLPPVTTILNFEYETHRTFYRTLDKMIDSLSISYVIPELSRIFSVLELHKPICDRLTSVGSMMSFVRNRDNIDRKLLKKDPKKVYMDFWQRLRNTKIDEAIDFTLIRDHMHSSDIERHKHELMKKISTLSYLINQSVEDTKTYKEDFVTSVICLNDNDVRPEAFDGLDLQNREYAKIRQRKKRQMRNVVGEHKRKKSEPEQVLWSMYLDAKEQNRLIGFYHNLNHVRRDILNRLIEEHAEQEAREESVAELRRMYSYKKRGKRAMKAWLSTLEPEDRQLVDIWIELDNENEGSQPQ